MSIILKNGSEANRAILSLKTGESIFTTDTRRLYVGSVGMPTGKEIEFGQLSASFVSASNITVTELTASKITAVEFSAQVTSMSVDNLEVTNTMFATCSQALTSSYLLGSVESASYVDYANVGNKPSLVSSSAQFSATDNVTFGQITASAIKVDTLIVNTISSSVEYVSGSTVHGSLSSNTHQFTGSVNITGSTNLYGKYTSTVNGASNSSTLYSYGGRAAVGLYSANGTEASPSGWTNGSEMGKVLFYSYGSTGFGAASSQIATIADGDQSDANKGTLISIQGTSSGSNTLTEWARFRNGNLGIGTTAPSAKLEMASESEYPDARVSGYSWVPAMSQQFARGTAASPTIVQNGDRLAGWFARAYRGDTFASDALLKVEVDGEPVANTYVPSRFVFETRNSTSRAERMRIDKDGNVGIGTTAPQASLDVSGSVYIRGGNPVFYSFRDFVGGSGSIGDSIGLVGFGADITKSTYTSSTAVSIKAEIDAVTGTARPRGRFRILMSDGYVLVERMRIDNAGNVGIGTTSPIAKVHSVAATSFIPTSAAISGSAFLADGLFGGGYVLRDGSAYSGLYAEAGYLRVGTGTSAGLSPRISISSAGNVGIGTTAPTCKLDVGDGTGNRWVRINGGNTTSSGAAVVFAASGSNGPCVGNYSGIYGGAFNGNLTLYGGAANILMLNAPCVGIGTAAPSGLLDVAKTYGGRFQVVNEGANTYNVITSRNSADSAYLPLTIRSGLITLSNYGAGTLITDSSGNVTATSDGRMKDVSGSFDRGLDAIINLSPKVYRWNKESGLNTDDVNVGLIAQEVLPYIPEAVSEKDGRYTMSDRPIIAALINAVKELKADNDQLRARIEALEA